MTPPLRIAYIRRFADAELIPALQGLDGTQTVVLSADEAIAGGLEGCDGIVTAGAKDLWTPAFAAAVQASGLRFIQNMTAGYDGIDLYELPGIAVYGNGGVLGAPVAEHGLAMLLTLMRRLDYAVLAQQQKTWLRKGLPQVLTLGDRRMTILGFGSIGRAAAKRARAFDMEVAALRRGGGSDPEADHVYSYEEMQSAFAATDVLFLAAPLTDETFRIVNETTLSWLKPGAVVVNVGRGDLICSEALQKALESGHLGGACLDVTAPEPLPDNHPLWSAPNVLISPHIAGGSDRAGAKLAAHVVANLRLLLQGERPSHVIRGH
ncbi:D-2-hydroxyacid dehydrogenase [Falsigemmobacter faecalis]|uniref:D-2-hydroxyacid dehydrogenase n=1 Tax=Falsigemmobacter faecalis TaxID=2488730 RepID=A0A3P3DWK6_9RHOB|nr:D-2-hydroxyacid dehydrogenase [Falsigemmobacter faecalis]RRH78136.1 D-2-hydroxyacid dehydrogenase [Falsigemmobacter faecalis]